MDGIAHCKNCDDYVAESGEEIYHYVDDKKSPYEKVCQICGCKKPEERK